MNILADENFPRKAVEILRERGHDVLWVRTDLPGSTDRHIAQLANIERRTLVTFDKDFGELVFRFGLRPSAGVVLFRIRASSSPAIVAVIVQALESRSDWIGHFSVIERDQIRMTAPRDSS